MFFRLWTRAPRTRMVEGMVVLGSFMGASLKGPSPDLQNRVERVVRQNEKGQPTLECREYSSRMVSSAWGAMGVGTAAGRLR